MSFTLNITASSPKHKRYLHFSFNISLYPLLNMLCNNIIIQILEYEMIISVNTLFR